MSHSSSQSNLNFSSIENQSRTISKKSRLAVPFISHMLKKYLKLRKNVVIKAVDGGAPMVAIRDRLCLDRLRQVCSWEECEVKPFRSNILMAPFGRLSSWNY